MTTSRFSILLLSLSLASCGSSQNDKVCLTPPSRAIELDAPAQTVGEQMVITSCIHNWSYRLAPAEGSNREVADAVLGGCRYALVKEANMAVKEATGKDADATSEAIEFDKLRRRYQDLALFHVVQARAGKCDAE